MKDKWKNARWREVHISFPVAHDADADSVEDAICLAVCGGPKWLHHIPFFKKWACPRPFVATTRPSPEEPPEPQTIEITNTNTTSNAGTTFNWSAAS